MRFSKALRKKIERTFDCRNITRHLISTNTMQFPILDTLFKRGEKYLQIDIEYFLSSNFWLILSYGITIIKGIILSSALARLLDEKVFGEYNFLLSIIGVLGIFGLPGMSTAIAQAAAVGSTAVYRNATTIILRWSLLGSVCLLVLPLFLPESISWGRMFSFMIIAAIFPMTTFTGIYSWYLGGCGNFKKMMTSNITYEIFHLITLLATLAVTNNALILVIVSVGTQAIIYGIYHFMVLRQLPSGPVDQETITYGKKLTLFSILSNFKFYGDKVFLAFFMNYETLAIYAIAAILPGQIYAIGKIIGISVFTKSAKQPYELLIASLHKKMIYLFLLFLSFSVGLYVIAPVAIPLIFSERYTTAIVYTQFLTFSVIFRSMGVVYQRILESHQVEGAIYTLNIVIPAVELITMFILIPLYGIAGLIGAKYISDLAYFLLALIFIYKRR